MDQRSSAIKIFFGWKPPVPRWMLLARHGDLRDACLLEARHGQLVVPGYKSVVDASLARSWQMFMANWPLFKHHQSWQWSTASTVSSGQSMVPTRWYWFYSPSWYIPRICGQTNITIQLSERVYFLSWTYTGWCGGTTAEYPLELSTIRPKYALVDGWSWCSTCSWLLLQLLAPWWLKLLADLN